ncbi:MAG: hypothetical protein JKY59_00070 [Emcibacter sp.]|nr:hypothetical protein [Emcibacter sp.]
MELRAGTRIVIEKGHVILFEDMVGLTGRPDTPMGELFGYSVVKFPEWGEIEVLGIDGDWVTVLSTQLINGGTAGSVDCFMNGLVFRVKKKLVCKWAEAFEVSHKDDRERSAKEIDKLRAKYC